jgi:hypothetical protein
VLHEVGPIHLPKALVLSEHQLTVIELDRVGISRLCDGDHFSPAA